MANSTYNLYGKKVSQTYHNLLQSGSDGKFYDGDGNEVTINATIPDIYVLTSSFNSFTSSYNTGSFTGSFTGSLLGTASYAANGGVTQLLAGPNITLSPTNGLGQVTITSTGGGGGTGNTATGSYGSFYDTTTQTNPVGNVPRSMSFNTTAITNGVSISGSTNPFNTYIKTENPGVYNLQFSAQLDKTDSGTDEIVIWLRKNGIDLIDTATSVSLIGNNAKNVAAWNFFVNSAANDYYQLIWYSPDTDLRLFAESAGGGHPGIPSVIATVDRVDQFLSNTGSFSGSFTGSLLGTSSWANNAVTSSYILNAISSSFASTASLAPNYVLNSATSSFVQNSQTGSFTLTSSFNSFTASINSFTSSYNTGSFTGSFTGSLLGIAATASYIITAQTASYVLNAVSSSFASTASLAPNYLLIANTSSMLSPYVLNSQTSSFTVLATGSITASVTPTQFQVTSGSSTELTVTGTGVTIGDALTDAHRVTGSLSITGSVTATYFTGSQNGFIYYMTGSPASISAGTGSEQVLTSITIPANVIQVGDRLEIFYSFNKVGTNAVAAYRVKISGSGIDGTLLNNGANQGATVLGLTTQNLYRVISTSSMIGSSQFFGGVATVGITVNYTGSSLTGSNTFYFNAVRNSLADAITLNDCYIKILR